MACVKRFAAFCGLHAVVWTLLLPMAMAATDGAQNDDIVTVAVRGTPAEGLSPLGTRAPIDSAAVEARAPVSVADLAILAPSAHVRTNSRGETLLFLRGSGERETAVFLDGAPLNVPWDNRVDLSALPASIVAGGAVVGGPVSTRFGARATGGALVLSTGASAERTGGQASLIGGSEDLVQLDGLVGLNTGRGHLLLAAGYVDHDGQPLADDMRLPFSQSADGPRTNTDLSMMHGFIRYEMDMGAMTVRASLLHVDSDQGVAPESDRDPETANVRFWRYPDNRYTMGIVLVEGPVVDSVRFSATAWHQVFDQTIDSFGSADFLTVEDRQEDDNSTWGLRSMLDVDIGRSILRMTMTGHVSTHRQREGTPDEIATLDREVFRERLVSGAVDWQRPLSEKLDVSLSAGFDWFAALETAGRTDTGDFFDYSLGAGLNYDLGDGWTLGLAAGRKARQPTLRELFGTALNRFLENPTLTPERTWLAETTLEWTDGPSAVRVTPYARITDNALDQRTVRQPDGPSLRQRINTPGFRLYGLEMEGRSRVAPGLDLSMRLTVQRARPRGEMPVDRIAERPSVIGAVNADYRHPSGFGARFEVEHIGRAWSEDTDGLLQPLGRLTRVNLTVDYRFAFTPGTHGELYLRADNLGDAFFEPQRGLPAPGLWLRAGARIRF